MGNQPTNQTVFPRITSNDITKDFFQLQRYSDQAILLWIDSAGYIHPARPALLTNSVLNNEQYVLNLKQGSGVTLVADEVGGVTITATGGSGGTPAGGDLAIQINHPDGTFYGDQNFIYDPTNNNIFGATGTGSLSRNATYSIVFGSGNNIGEVEGVHILGNGGVNVGVGSSPNSVGQVDAFGAGIVVGANCTGEVSNIFVAGAGGTNIGNDCSGSVGSICALGPGLNIANNFTGSGGKILDDFWVFAGGAAVATSGTAPITVIGVLGSGIQVANRCTNAQGGNENLFAIGGGLFVCNDVSGSMNCNDMFTIGSGNFIGISNSTTTSGVVDHQDLIAIGFGISLDNHCTLLASGGDFYALGDDIAIGNSNSGAANSLMFGIGESITMAASCTGGTNTNFFAFGNTIDIANTSSVTNDSLFGVGVGIILAGTTAWTSNNFFAFGHTLKCGDTATKNLTDLYNIGYSNSLEHNDTFAFGTGITSAADHSMYIGYGATAGATVKIGVTVATAPEVVISKGIITLNSLLTPQKFTVSALPAGAEGQVAYASNGRKSGEGAGSGTGTPVYYSNGQWRVFSTDAQVTS